MFNGDFKYYGPIVISNNNMGGLALYNIYPNPANNLFFIDLYSKNPLPVNVHIYDLFGRLVYTKSFLVNGISKFKIESLSWASGVYIVKVINEQLDFNKVRSVIVE